MYFVIEELVHQGMAEKREFLPYCLEFFSDTPSTPLGVGRN